MMSPNWNVLSSVRSPSKAFTFYLAHDPKPFLTTDGPSYWWVEATSVDFFPNIFDPHLWIQPTGDQKY